MKFEGNEIESMDGRHSLSSGIERWIAALLMWIAALMPSAALADGGVVIAEHSAEGIRATVFAAPFPLKAGPVDFSVFLQDPETGKPILDGEVELAWEGDANAALDWVPPCCSMKGSGEPMAARRGHSQNKLLYSAIVSVPSAGKSALWVRVERGDRSAEFSCALDVRKPVPPLAAYWPLLALPPICIAGYVFNRKLSGRAG